MHKIRGQARNVAWTDSKNPFAKRAYSNSSKTRDVQSQLEAGNGAPLFRPNTDDPYDYPAQRSSDGLAPEWSVEPQTKSPTVPAAVSRKRTTEPGDHIGQVPRSTSPPASLRKLPVQGETIPGEKAMDATDGSDRTLTEQYDQRTNDDEKPKKRGIKGWFKRSSKNEKGKDSEDDNNGKDKKAPQKFTAASQIRATIFSSWINLLLVASPVGIALYYAHVNAIIVFVVNFIAIIPLAGMLSYATEEIALRTGEVIGGLLNASFGNAVELIVSIIALTQNQILIVQTSLIGSMLSNLLLVLGMCFFAGGVNRMEQAFNMTVAQTASSLLFLAVSSLLIPTAFNEWANTGSTDKTTSGSTLVPGEASLSRATAILLLIVYASYLFFQLKSHVGMYSTASEKNKTRDFSKQKDKMKNMVPAKIRRRSVEASSTNSKQNEHDDEDDDEPEQPQLSLWVAIATLAASTVLVALNAEYLVDSIDAITCGGGISKNFVGLILLPIVGNAAEHATAVTVAIKDKMDLAIGVAVGSSMQIALLVLPLMVVLGWIIGKDDMTLYFDGFQIAVLFVAILLVNYLIQDGKSHWLEGVLLMILYVIIAVAAWFYPTAPGLSDCPAS